MTQTNISSAMERQILRVSLESKPISDDIAPYCMAISPGEECECVLCLIDVTIDNGVKTHGKHCNCNVIIHQSCLTAFWKRNGIKCLMCNKNM